MKNLLLGFAIATVAFAAPALAGDKKTNKMKNEAAGASSNQSAELGRGGLQEWPVSKEEADWSRATAPTESGGASTGTSTGASGSEK